MTRKKQAVKIPILPNMNIGFKRSLSHSIKQYFSVKPPSIIVLDIEFQTWESTGKMTFSGDSQEFATITATPETPTYTLNAIYCLGADWVMAISIYSQIIVNAIYFPARTEGVCWDLQLHNQHKG